MSVVGGGDLLVLVRRVDAYDRLLVVGQVGGAAAGRLADVVVAGVDGLLAGRAVVADAVGVRVGGAVDLEVEEAGIVVRDEVLLHLELAGGRLKGSHAERVQLVDVPESIARSLTGIRGARLVDVVLVVPEVVLGVRKPLRRVELDVGQVGRQEVPRAGPGDLGVVLRVVERELQRRADDAVERHVRLAHKEPVAVPLVDLVAVDGGVVLGAGDADGVRGVDAARAADRVVLVREDLDVARSADPGAGPCSVRGGPVGVVVGLALVPQRDPSLGIVGTALRHRVVAESDRVVGAVCELQVAIQGVRDDPSPNSSMRKKIQFSVALTVCVPARPRVMSAYS